jgi:hypothetical protein
MICLRQHIGKTVAIALAIFGFRISSASAQEFLPDDPIKKVPEVASAQNAGVQAINPTYDFLFHSVKYKTPPATPSLGINTLGEVPDSSWFTNRPGLTIQELRTGPRIHGGPKPPFAVIAAKTEGVTPGFRIKDARGLVYFVKVDPISNPEMATAADVVGSLFLYAAGYNVPENYILLADREDFHLSEKATITALSGKRRPMSHSQLEKILKMVPTQPDGRIRLMASLTIEGRIIGPFRYESTRSDDPNDLIPHQQRRDLRGLEVLFAWLNHTDAKGDNSLDSVVGRGADARVIHHLLDFGDSFGSDSDIAKDPRHGQENWLPTSSEQAKRAGALGLVPAKWETVEYPYSLPAAGNFTAASFNPLQWKPNYPNPAFLEITPEDGYWGAKHVMAFSDDDIRAIVEEGQFSDPAVTDYLTKVLIARRDLIGRAWFSLVAPLEDFAFVDGRLHYTDLDTRYGLLPASSFNVVWFLLGDHPRRVGSSYEADPTDDDRACFCDKFIGCTLTDSKDPRKSVTVVFEWKGDRWETVAIDRTVASVSTARQ